MIQEFETNTCIQQVIVSNDKIETTVNQSGYFISEFYCIMEEGISL